MYAAIVKALVNTNGIDISGKNVEMPAGSYHLVSKHDLRYYLAHPDAFSIVREADLDIPALLATDASGNTTGLRDGAGNTHATLGTRVVTVGTGGRYSTLADAIAAIAPSGAGYDLATARFTRTETITVTNGSAVVTGSGTNWQNQGTIPGYVNDLWKPAASSKYYRIRSIDSDTQMTLWEPYTGTTISAAATEYSAYYLDRTTILMLPGHHRASGVNLAMGIDLVALHRGSVIISEISGTPATPFNDMYDAQLSNLTFAPTAFWGDLDGLCIGATCPAGAYVVHTNVHVRCANDGQAHQGGSLRIPGCAGSTVVYDGCTIESAKTPSITMSDRVTPSNENTRMVFKGGTEFRVVRDADSGVANLIIFPAALVIGALGTYDFIGSISDVPDDLNLDPLVGNIGAIAVSAACVINLHGHRARSTNSNVNGNAYCLQTDTAASTVNIFGSDLEASGTDGTAIVVGGGATVNIRAGSRVKGSTNSIDCASGTVNVSGNADLIGTTTGAGTINLATAT